MAACFVLSASGAAAFWFLTAGKITDGPQTDENATAQEAPKPAKIKSSPVLGKDIPGLPEYCADKLISVSGCDGMTEITTDQGNTYRLVEIGDQCWFADNLKEVPSTDQGWYGYYDDADEEPAPGEGLLYTWDAAMNGETNERAQGVCPAGWHLPSRCELIYWASNTSKVSLESSIFAKNRLFFEYHDFLDFPGVVDTAQDYFGRGDLITLNSSSWNKNGFPESISLHRESIAPEYWSKFPGLEYTIGSLKCLLN